MLSSKLYNVKSVVVCIYIQIYIYEVYTISFQTFFRMGTFINSKHMKL